MVVDIQQIGFDYAALDTDTRVFVQEKAQNIHSRLKRTAEDVFVIGQDLLEVKSVLSRGQFANWLQLEFDMGQATAYSFMQVANRFKENFTNFVNLPVSVLYELAAPRTPDTIVELVESGTIPPTIAAIREAKQEAQPHHEEPMFLGRVNNSYPPEVHPLEYALYDTWKNAVTPKIEPVEDIQQIRRQLKEQEREIRRDENRQAIAHAKTIDEALGLARFATIVIDPPWDWNDEGDVDQLGRAKPVYGTMSIEELLDFPVGTYADNDCHLYLWITNRSLPKGFRLLERWGFRYVTCITWVKPSFGMGNYFRGQTEHILFGVKGSQMLKRKDVGTVFNAPRGPKGHSSKPVEAYPLIESCSPGPYLELFARSERPDWTSWGAEV